MTAPYNRKQIALPKDTLTRWMSFSTDQVSLSKAPARLEEKPRAGEPQCYLNSQSPDSAELGLQDVRGLGSRVCIPLGIADVKHIDEKLAETTHTHAGPTRHASGGLRWINLKVAGWVSTVRAAAPAWNWDGNPLLSHT